MQILLRVTLFRNYSCARQSAKWKTFGRIFGICFTCTLKCSETYANEWRDCAVRLVSYPSCKECCPVGFHALGATTGTDAQTKRWGITSPQILCSRAGFWGGFPCLLPVHPAGGDGSTVEVWERMEAPVAVCWGSRLSLAPLLSLQPSVRGAALAVA